MKISHPRVWLGLGGIAGLLGLAAPSAQAQNLADTIEKIKPSIVAIGTFQKTRRPPSIFRGTGFIVADGLHVVTNAHVLQEKIDTEKKKRSRYLAANPTGLRYAKRPSSLKTSIMTS